MLSEEIRTRMIAAMRAKDVVAKEVLRVALGEIQTIEARGQTVDDEQAARILRGLVKSIEESRDAARDEAAREKLTREIGILTDLLPRTLSPEEIVAALAPIAEAIAGAGNDGQATGLAMKHLKQAGATVQGKDVARAVASMRASD